MTKREAISRVKILVKELNADSRLTNKYVWSSIDSKSKLIIQRENDALKLSRIQSMYKTLPCVKMEEAPYADNCCEVKTYCTVFRSVYPLPEMYTDSHGFVLRQITTIDGSQEIRMVTPQQARRIKQDKNSKYDKTIYGFLNNNYLYITNKKFPLVRVEGMFIDDVSNLKNSPCATVDTTANCKLYLDQDWNVPPKLEEGIINMVVEELSKVYKRIIEDNNLNKNNAS